MCCEIVTENWISLHQNNIGRQLDIGPEFMFTVEVRLNHFPHSSCGSIFYVGHDEYPCATGEGRLGNSCLPNVRLCFEDPIWNTGLFVDFNQHEFNDNTLEFTEMKGPDKNISNDVKIP